MKIFVQIPAWRDEYIVKTIESAYSQATFPDNITFGIIWQGYEEDNWMIEPISSLKANVKVIKIDAATAPLSLCRMRNMATPLITDETYYMQVDSHTMFKKDWDTFLMVELELAEEFFGKSIITGQATSFWSWDEPFAENTRVTVPDEELFEKMGAPVVGQFFEKDRHTQVQEVFFNAGCVFAPIEYAKDVPQPPDILFQYEQPMMGLRTWTAGWNMISPSQSYVCVFDFYKNPYEHAQHNRRVDDPNWNDKWGNKEQENKQLFNDIMSGTIIDNRNGPLGARSLKEYIEFIGYDPVTLKIFRKHDPYAPGNFQEILPHILEGRRLHKELMV